MTHISRSIIAKKIAKHSVLTQGKLYAKEKRDIVQLCQINFGKEIVAEALTQLMSSRQSYPDKTYSFNWVIMLQFVQNQTEVNSSKIFYHLFQLQQNFNGSNSFGIMKICSRQGKLELMSVSHSARPGGIIGMFFRFSLTLRYFVCSH